MQKTRCLYILSFLLLLYSGKGQEWKWNWASFATARTVNSSFASSTGGYHSIIYSKCEYDSLICAGDTVIRHPEIYGSNTSNCAVIMYDYSGAFIDLVDLHTLPGAMIYNTAMGVDENENLTLSCSFSRRVFIQDTIINHCNTPYIDLLDVMVAQLDKNREINWARTIGGTLSDETFGQIVMPNGDIYILSEHIAGGSPPTVIDFFQQDTVIVTQGFTAISKLDQNGIFHWRIKLNGNFSVSNLLHGKDGLLYLWGDSKSPVIINDHDTVTSGNPSLMLPFICSFDPDGTVLNAEFVDFPINPRGLTVDSKHNFYVSAAIYDTLVIQDDTTIVPQDLSYQFLGKFDPKCQPVWYHIFPTVANQQLGGFCCVPEGDDLVFASYSNRSVPFGDTTIEIHNARKAFIGIFDQKGDLKEITISNVYGEFLSSSLMLDKCGDFILSGHLAGSIYLEDDTASSYSQMKFDAAVAKVQRFEPAVLNLGPDTSGCREYWLAGPPGLLEYSLNDSLMNQNYYRITETGNYIFGCSDDGCWAYDTIFIGIHPGIALDLGSDTAIFLKDSITLTVPAVYDSIRWFDGSGGFVKVIYGNDYLPGTYHVYADVFSGPCSTSDTLLLEIKSDFGIEELSGPFIYAFPNPFRNNLFIEVSEGINKINIIDYQGIIRYSREIDSASGKIKLELDDLGCGIYLLKVTTLHDKIFVVKIVKD